MVLLKTFAFLLALPLAGMIAAVAVAAGTSTTGTVSVCADASVPPSTLARDGADIYTEPGKTDHECATTTYTVPTVTETVTVAGTTTANPPADPTYEQAISYSNTRPAFTPSREVDVASSSELKAAISNLQAGDLVKATSAFTVSASSGNALVINKRLSAPAEIDLTGVTIKYTGTAQTDAVWLNNPSNLMIFGGDVSSGQGYACIRLYGGQNVLWWGFNAHNCGADGFQAQGIGGPVDHDDFQGAISDVGQNYLAWDNHPEKGTGLHGANLWDANQTTAFTNNRFAFDMHDIPVGACVEYGNDSGSNSNNTLYLRCVNATFVAQTQTAGNALQAWGSVDPNLDVKYLEGSNLQGQAYRDAGLSSGADASGVTIEYGRASNTNLNPRYAGQTTWQHSHGEKLLDVQPAP